MEYNSFMAKWKTLEHLGPLFPPEYEYQKYKIRVADRETILPKEAEELIYHWAAKIQTDYVKDSVFQKNFWKDLKPLLPKDLQGTRFPQDWDVVSIYRDIERKREAKKNRSKEEKKAEKEEKANIKEKYGFATLDGDRVPLGNYMVEPPGLFMGRGKHPLRGRFKPRIYPEDITLNFQSENLSPPRPNYFNQNREWKEVVQNTNAYWTARWYCKLTGSQKRVLFGATSTVKQKADRDKFEKAINLANNFDNVVEYINSKLTNKSKHTRQVATVAKIISELAIRVGDEKSEDEAETFGATTLLKKHITINGQDVSFDFLGKDSIQYHNTTTFPQSVVDNIREALDGKKDDDQIFPHISSSDVNEFLGNKLPGLTAKQFRTAIGSTLLARELEKQGVPENISSSKKLKYYIEANLSVAVKLNHHSAVSEAYDRSLDNMKEKLKAVKTDLKEKKSEMKKALEEAKETKEQRVAFAKERRTGQKQRDAIKRANDAYKKKKLMLENRIQRLQERVDNMESKIEIKKKTRGVALNTSKTNYVDPRIPVSWCKDHDVEVKRVFTKTLQEKFEWAMDVGENFYKKYPEV